MEFLQFVFDPYHAEQIVNTSRNFEYHGRRWAAVAVRGLSKVTYITYIYPKKYSDATACRPKAYRNPFEFDVFSTIPNQNDLILRFFFVFTKARMILMNMKYPHKIGNLPAQVLDRSQIPISTFASSG